MQQARHLFVQALEIECDNPEALAGLATTHIFEVLNGYYDTGNANRLDLADVLLTRALAVDPHAVLALKAKAALLRAQGRFDEAIMAAEAVIADNPGEPWAYKEIGLSNLYLGRVEQSLGWFAKADMFGPRDPGRWTWLDSQGHALVLLGRDLEAIRFLRMALDANPNAVSPHAFLAAAYALHRSPGRGAGRAWAIRSVAPKRNGCEFSPRVAGAASADKSELSAALRALEGRLAHRRHARATGNALDFERRCLSRPRACSSSPTSETTRLSARRTDLSDSRCPRAPCRGTPSRTRPCTSGSPAAGTASR